jgi:hypothetical protein
MNPRAEHRIKLFAVAFYKCCRVVSDCIIRARMKLMKLRRPGVRSQLFGVGPRGLIFA